MKQMMAQILTQTLDLAALHGELNQKNNINRY